MSNTLLSRPVLIDEQDGPCPICQDWSIKKIFTDNTGRTSRCCDECSSIIPEMGLMRGSGFDSITPHHFHLRGIGPSSIPGRTGILQELCPSCYKIHREKVYPSESKIVLDRRCSGEGL